MPMKTILNIDNVLLKQDQLGLYIHVPFCHARCAYCDFYSQTTCDDHSMSAFVNAMKTSIITYAPLIKSVSTVYVGGGTPSVIGKHLVEILNTIFSELPVIEGAEVTVEVNPESLTKELLDAYIAAGVNRISMGVQACDDETLKRLGRIHTMAQTDAALALLRAAGIAFSVDFIVGMPNVAPEAIHSWLAHVQPYKPSHISVYPLSVEEGTPFSRIPAFQDIDEDAQADALLEAWSAVEGQGFEHYEVSNFARPGCRSKHNSSYWNKTPYLGIGPSASSMLMNTPHKRIRFILRDDLVSFTDDTSHNVLGDVDIIDDSLEPFVVEREDIMLAMRTNQGIDAETVEKVHLREVFEKFVDEGLCVLEEELMRLTPTQRGWLLGNEMFGAIWCADEKN